MTDSAGSTDVCERNWTARRQAVVSRAEAFAFTRASTAYPPHLLALSLAGWQGQDDQLDQLVHLHSVPLIYAGLWGAEAPAYPLAAAAVLAVAGQALLYGGGFGAGRSPWEGLPPAEALRIGDYLLHGLPYMVIDDLEAPPNTRAAMRQTLSAGLVRVAASRPGTPTPALLGEDAVRGAELPATFAALSAQLAGASPRVVRACRRLGYAMGVAVEFRAAGGRETRHDLDALPVPLNHVKWADGTVAASGRAPPARTPPAVLYHRRALSALADAGLLEPGRGQLRTLIEAILVEEG
ncbi:MAG TPA: hypothetical protein VNL71_13140 [Chloroflexota bacterium]|nr:hypothetical protein [Chloroflexota bacterium]